MPDQTSTASVGQSVVERIDRVRETIERIIGAVGEHPECELKIEWLRNTPYHKAEAVKDIQAIANSSIAPGSEKYIVIGVDEQTRSYTGCNHDDYDEAALRQLLASNLDRVPEFELLKLHASGGAPIIVIRIPHQEGRPFIAKGTIADPSGRIFLQAGDIYHKPGGPQTSGTGKQRVTTRDALIAMFDLDAVAEASATERINQMLPTIRLEERTRLGGSGVIPVLTATDDEFEAYVEQSLISSNELVFNIMLEKLSDKTIAIWERRTESAGQTTPDEILRLKEEFLPAMRRLTQLGLLLVKFSAPVDLFSKIADQLFEVLRVSNLLRRVTPSSQREEHPASLAEHDTYSVPALEALISSYLLAGYSLKKTANVEYFSSIFPRVASFGDSLDSERSRLFLFWPYFWEGGPRVDMDLLVVQRYGGDNWIKRIVGESEEISRIMRRADCLLEWHSFLSFPEQRRRPAGSTETVEYLTTKYPAGALRHFPFFIRERLSEVSAALQLIAENFINGQNNFFSLDEGLTTVLRTIDRSRREVMFGNYLVYSAGEQAERMSQSGRFAYSVYWPERLQNLVEKADAPRAGGAHPFWLNRP